jgi:hypothetical protein
LNDNQQNDDEYTNFPIGFHRSFSIGLFEYSALVQPFKAVQYLKKKCWYTTIEKKFQSVPFSIFDSYR